MKLILGLLLALSGAAFADSVSIGIGGGLPTGTIGISNLHPGTGEIVILGDSLAAGYGGKNSVGIPATCLADTFPGNPIENLSVPGLTSAEILTKIGQVSLLKPKLIFVSAGGNDTIMDYFKPGTYPEAKTMTELGQLFDDLLATGAVVAYLGLNPPYPNTSRLPLAADLARSKGVIVVDGMAGLWTDKSKMSDEFHPNPVGYLDLCNALRSSVTGVYP